MRLSIVICEDEKSQRRILCTYISKILDGNSYEVIEFSSGEELLNNYPEHVDILLLDIQMKDINGIETARKIRDIDTNVNIIFTTAIIDFMQQGYEVKAFRYLLKPIKYNEFSKHLLECVSEIYENSKNFFCFKDVYSGDIMRISVNSILYIETEQKYTLIHTDSIIYKCSSNLNNIEKNLTSNKFYRCHRSYLINIDKVKRLKKNTVIIKDSEILVSRYKMKKLKLCITAELGNLLC